MSGFNLKWLIYRARDGALYQQQYTDFESALLAARKAGYPRWRIEDNAGIVLAMKRIDKGDAGDVDRRLGFWE